MVTATEEHERHHVDEPRKLLGPLWSEQTLSVRIDGPEGTSVVEVDFPFARVGSHHRSEVVLAGPDVAVRHLYLHATAGGVYCLNLAESDRTGQAVEFWLDPEQPVQVGPYRLQVATAPIGENARDEPEPNWNSEPLPGIFPIANLSRERTPRKKPIKAESVRYRIRRHLTTLGNSTSYKVPLLSKGESEFHCVLFREGLDLWLIDLFSSPAVVHRRLPIDAARISYESRLILGEIVVRFGFLKGTLDDTHLRETLFPHSLDASSSDIHSLDRLSNPDLAIIQPSGSDVHDASVEDEGAKAVSPVPKSVAMELEPSRDSSSAIMDRSIGASDSFDLQQPGKPDRGADNLKRVQRLVAERDQLRRERKQQEQELEELREQLKQRTDEAKREVEALRGELIETLTAEFNSRRDERIEELEKQLAEARQESQREQDQRQTEREAIGIEREAWERDCAEKMRVQEALKAELALLSERVEEVDRNRERFEQERAQWEQEREQWARCKAEMEQLLDDQQVERESVQAAVQTELTALDQRRAEVEAASQEVVSQQQALEALRVQWEQSQSALQQERSEWESQQQTYLEKLAAFDRVQSDWEAERHAENQRLEQWQVDLDQLASQLTQREQQLKSESERQLMREAAVTRELQELHEKFSAQAADLAAKTAALMAAEEQAVALRQAMAASEAERLRLQSALASSEQDANATREELESTRRNHQVVMADLAVAQQATREAAQRTEREQEELKVQVAALESELASQRAQLAQAQEQAAEPKSDPRVAMLEAELTGANESLAAIEQRLAEESQQHADRVRELEQKLAEQTSAVDQSQQEAQALREKLASAERQIEVTKTAEPDDQADSALSELRAQLEDREARLRQDQQQLEAARKTFEREITSQMAQLTVLGNLKDMHREKNWFGRVWGSWFGKPPQT